MQDPNYLQSCFSSSPEQTQPNKPATVIAHMHVHVLMFFFVTPFLSNSFCYSYQIQFFFFVFFTPFLSNTFMDTALPSLLFIIKWG